MLVSVGIFVLGLRYLAIFYWPGNNDVITGGVENHGYGSVFRTDFLRFKATGKEFIVWSKIGVFQLKASTGQGFKNVHGMVPIDFRNGARDLVQNGVNAP